MQIPLEKNKSFLCIEDLHRADAESIYSKIISSLAAKGLSLEHLFGFVLMGPLTSLVQNQVLLKD